MSPRRSTPPVETLQRPAMKLLQALAAPGAYAVADDLAEGFVVVAPRNGVSAPAGRASAAAVEALLARGLAAMDRAEHSGRSRLIVTPEGTSWLARTGAPTPETAFLAQHAVLERRPAPGDCGSSVLVNAQESPLAWLARRRLVDAVACEAGERLRRDLELGAMLPRVTANWSTAVAASARGAGSGAAEMADRTLAARQRATQALAAAGPEFAGLLMDVCGFLKGLETVEAERGWPRRSGKVALGLALCALARHYGLGERAQGPRRGGGLRHWGAGDYRPRISPLQEAEPPAGSVGP
jgi:hypothetical protein